MKKTKNKKRDQATQQKDHMQELFVTREFATHDFHQQE